MPSPRLNVAVLLSGSGTTLQNLIDERSAGRLAVDFSTVISSRPGLKGGDRAVAAGLDHTVLDRRSFPTTADFSRAVFDHLDRSGADLVCLAGWLCLLEIPKKYRGRVMNIHPSLLPAFGGRGMFGHHVHRAVLARGCKVTGCTVHFVDDAYDAGPIILQRTCPVLADDTPDTLAARVFDQEKIAYPEAVRLYQTGRLTVVDRNVVVAPGPG